MKKILTFLLTPFLINACTAQQNTTQREILPPPTIQVNNLRNGESPIRVSDVKIDLKVVGNMAVTTVDMTFYNPNNRILEGELQFPLAEGQNISRFALDINGKLREGVVVDKAKGQEVFESVIRQNIDPGLLEKTQGNNFRTRIYPLPAKGNRRIVLAYEQELPKADGNMAVFLPVEYKDTLNTFALNVQVFGNETKPNVEETPWGNFKFDKSGEAYIASYKAENFPAKGQLVFSVPDKKEQRVFVEKGKISGETVFYAQIDPDKVNRSKKLPSNIALFWDASLSMEDRDLKSELGLLTAYFKEVGNVNVNLHVFNSAIMPVKSFQIKKGDWTKLREYLQNTNYDGATQLGLINLNTKADEIILMTDGLSNFGNTMPLIGTTPVTTISSTLKADYSMLQYIASGTGGKFINLTQQTPDAAVKQMLQDSYRLISYETVNITDFTTSGTIINPEAVFSVAGKLKEQTGTITLNFGIGNEIISRKTVTIQAKEAADYDNITERIWAQKKITYLDLLYESNKEEIESLGRKYNIVTRNTSLIVLDRIEDYVQHEITPPEELRDEYTRLTNNIKSGKAKSKKQHIDYVASRFNDRKQWWNRSYPKTRGLKKHYDRDMNSQVLEMSAIDDAEMDVVRESRMVVADEAPRATVQFTPPVIARDEEVQEESMMMDMVVSEESVNKVKEADYSDKSLQPNKPTRASIQLKGWNPDTPYLSILRSKKKEELYQAYLDIRKEYRNTPSFYLDVATLFEEKGLKQEALIILSNLAELEVENYRLLRVLAHRLQQLGYTEYAIGQFEVVLKLRPEEPQSYRDLALANEQNKEYQKAIDLLHRIIEKPWDGRFPEIEVIAAEEMNKVITKAAQNKTDLDLSNIDKRLIYAMPVDIRIVLNWDTDNSDMDLWVTDPYGERCFYQNTLTHIGGLISRDFTGGYGPEEFLIKKAVAGRYKIQANYFGSREQTLIGPTTVYLDIYTRYSSGQEKKETITLRLTENKEVIDIGEITFSHK